MKLLLCNMRPTLLKWRTNLRKLKRCLSKVKQLGPNKKLSLSRNLNSLNINLRMRRKNLRSKDLLMIPWLKVSNLLTENLWLEEKKHKSKLMKWNRNSWTRERSKRSNITSTERLCLIKMNNLRRITMKSN